MFDRPIIVTLQMDHKSAEFFDAQRKKYFPADINFVPAHLTLFHELAGRKFDHVLEIVAEACAAETPFAIKIQGLLKLGRGVAYLVQSERLTRFRAGLARSFARLLSGQDLEGFHPHVTIQNKVSPQAAQALYKHLSDGFAPFEPLGEGVQLWRYEGAGARRARWTPAGAIAFAGGA